MPEADEPGTCGHIEPPFPAVRRRTGASVGARPDEAQDPETFTLVHDGGSKWLLHEPMGMWDRVIDPSTGERLLFHGSITRRIAELAASKEPLLISGGSGMGAHQLARIIAAHDNNPRRHEALEIVDCEAMQPDETTVDLFGRNNKDRTGKLVACNGGTIVVRRIDLLTPSARRRLATFMKHREVRHQDADRATADVDVRLLATARLDEDGRVAPLGELGALFPDSLNLPALREAPWGIAELLSEFFCPYDVIRDVHVTWLLELLSHPWPGNMRELRAYCETAKASARGSCSVLNGDRWPLASDGELAQGSIASSRAAMALMALAERKLRQSTIWSDPAGVPDDLANSLRLLAQLSLRDEFDDGVNGRSRQPYYFHPHAIPLELFLGGLRIPDCYYDITNTCANQYPSATLQGLLLGVAQFAADPGKFSMEDHYRAAIGADGHAIGSLQPSQGFVNWVARLRASVPNYETMRKMVDMPSIEQLRPEMAPHRAVRKKRTDRKRRGDSHAFFREFEHLDPKTFTWTRVGVCYDAKGEERVSFRYDGTRTSDIFIKELPGIGNLKSDRMLTQEGHLFRAILKSAGASFSLDDVITQCSRETRRERGGVTKTRPFITKDAARETVRRLNRLLWALFFETPQPSDKTRNAIVAPSRERPYEIRFSVVGVDTAQTMTGNKRDSSAATGSRKASQHESVADDEKDESDDPGTESADDQWKSEDVVTGLPIGPGCARETGRRGTSHSESGADDDDEDDSKIQFERPGTLPDEDASE